MNELHGPPQMQIGGHPWICSDLRRNIARLAAKKPGDEFRFHPLLSARILRTKDGILFCKAEARRCAETDSKQVRSAILVSLARTFFFLRDPRK